MTFILRQDRGLILDVRDTGRGIQPGSPTIRSGLATIQDRLSTIGGTLRLESTAGTGVHLHADIPLPRQLRKVNSPAHNT